MTHRLGSAARGLRYRAAWQTLGWLAVLVVIALSLRPQPSHLPSVLGWDKAQHAAAYAVLTWWFAQAFARPGPLHSACSHWARGSSSSSD